MILNSIILDNIRSYFHQEVEFSLGTSLFEGDVGSGKSTILMAIEFALFGLGSQKAESLLSKKSPKGYVVLEFTVDDVKYEIKRALKRTKSGVAQDPRDSWIKINGENHPLSPSELKQKVLQILRFNEPADPKAESRIFRYAIFTPQEAMKEVLTDPQKRLETIRRAFGIEDYGIAQFNASQVLSEINALARVSQAKFSNVTELESQIKRSTEQVTLLDTEITENRKQSEILKSQRKKENTEIQQLQEKNNERIRLLAQKNSLEEKFADDKLEIKKIQTECQELESELKDNEQKMTELREIKKPDTKKNAADMNQEIKKRQQRDDKLARLESQIYTISKDIANIKEKIGDRTDSNIDTIKESLSKMQDEKNTLEASQIKITEEIDIIKSQKTQKETLIDSVKKEILKFSKLGEKCPTCMQEIKKDHHHQLVKEKQDKQEKLNTEFNAISDLLSESEKRLKGIQDRFESNRKEITYLEKTIPKIGEFQAKKAEIADIETRIKETKEMASGNDSIDELVHLKDRLVKYENATGRIMQITESSEKTKNTMTKRQAESKSASERIAKTESELNDLKDKLDSSIDLKDEIQKKNAESEMLQKEITKVSSMIAASDENRKNEKMQIDECQKKMLEAQKWKAKYQKYSQFKEWIEDFFIQTISQIEKQVLISILQNFNETYAKLYSILIEDSTKESKVDENFTPIVEQDGFEQEVGFLSGGEKTSIALAYRLTLNILMRKETDSLKSNLLILDEPTDGFSKSQLAKIGDIFEELKSDQVILVSHESELESHVENVFKISKEDGLSKISKQ